MTHHFVMDSPLDDTSIMLVEKDGVWEMEAVHATCKQRGSAGLWFWVCDTCRESYGPSVKPVGGGVRSLSYIPLHEMEIHSTIAYSWLVYWTGYTMKDIYVKVEW